MQKNHFTTGHRCFTDCHRRSYFPLFRIEGMAPMSSVLNVIIGCLVGPFYAFAITLMTGIIRMLILGIPPLALTGAVFGGVLSALFYRWTNRVGGAWLGEIIGTGIIGSLLSYPVMILFTGSSNGLYGSFTLRVSSLRPFLRLSGHHFN